MNLWSKLKSIFAGRPQNIPNPLTIPNQLYTWYQTISNNNKQQQKATLPKNPTFIQLRNFAKNAIVRRPINYIEDTITRLPYRFTNVNIEDTNDYTVEKTTVTTIIENPNVIHNRKKFLRMILDDLVTLDQAAFEKTRGGNPNRPLFLYPTDGATIQFVVPYDYTNEDGHLYAQMQPTGEKRFSAKQLAFIQRNVFTDRPQGLSPVLTAYNYIQYLLDGGQQANDTASNATASFLINLGKGITEQQLNAFRTYFEEEIQGTGKIPLVSGDGVESKQIRAINSDGLYLDWLEFLTTIVALAFPFPPEKMGVTRSNDRSTTEDHNETLLNELIKVYGSIIEDAINEHVLKPLGYDKLFKFELIYTESETDKTKKSDRITKEFISGVISENEARKLLGYKQSDSKYADLTTDERKAKINQDMPVNGFAGLATNRYGDKQTTNKLDS